MASVVARLHAVEQVAPDIYRIELRLGGAAFRFAAGQYLTVRQPGGIGIPFSIASAPERLPALEIHFRPVAGAQDATAMLELIDTAQAIEIEGPAGDVQVRGPTAGSLALVAGGTGIGQCRAIVEHLTYREQTAPVRLFWSVSTPVHLYDVAYYQRICNRHAWFSFETLIDEPGHGSAAVAHVAEHGPPQEDAIILAGSPGFVYALTDTIAAHGGDCSRIRSDVFAYAPRQR